MQEYDVFSQYIGNSSELDSLWIKLTSDTELGITLITPLAMSLSEKLDRGTPSVIFDFVDGHGDLANHNLPQAGAIFNLDIGRSFVDITRIQLRMTKINSINSSGGSERLTYRMYFVHSGWDKFMGQTINRAWVDTNPTDVVQQIATECGWEKTIMARADTAMTIIQPNWTNVELIKWLTDQCTTDGGRPRYAARIDGSFIFKSIQSMINDQSDMAMRGEIPLLRMQDQVGKYEREEGTAKNSDIPQYFTNYKINEAHVDTRLAGAGGVRSYTYDSHADKFMIDEYNVSDLDGLQMSDWTASSNVLAKSNTFMFNGRGGDNKSKALSKISRATDMAIELEITHEGSIDMRIGMMLEILIPIPPAVGSGEPYNLMYSGFWMTSGILHLVDFSKSTITTNTSLVRSGHDSAQLSGFSKTKGGKFVRRET